MPLTERDRACFGPRDAKPLGSLAWCWQTLDLLKTRWQRKDFTDQQFGNPHRGAPTRRVECRATPAALRLPGGLLLAELGQSVPAAPPQGTPCVTPPGPTGGRRGLRQGTPPGHRHTRGDPGLFWGPGHVCVCRLRYHQPHALCGRPAAAPRDLGDYRVRALPRVDAEWHQAAPYRVASGHAARCFKPDPWKTPPAWHQPLLHPGCAPARVSPCRRHVCAWREGAGDSSHNCEAWVGEVNRVAPLLGFADVRCARSKPTRKGKVVTRQTEGNIALRDFATFPWAPLSAGDPSAYYTGGTLPRCPLPPGWRW